MNFKTTQCSHFSHPEIQFSCDDSIPHQDTDWFIKHLENEVTKGVVFKPEETIQLGFMLIKIAFVNDELLQLMEPNMRDFPIQFENNLTHTLKYFRQQQDIVDSSVVSLDADFPSIIESIILSNSFESTRNFYLNREEKNEHHSGWFFRDISNHAEEEYQQISLYEFALKRPDAIKYLGMPAGIGILSREGDSVRIIQGEDELEISQGSFLDGLNSVNN